jgi:hypothetical protein
MNVLWKEWRQQRLLFGLGAVLGILFPLFDLLHKRGDGRWTQAGSMVVFIFGALYALILAVATTHDDVQHGASEFWQSRPVRAGQVFTTKLLLGAVLLLAAFVFVESLDLARGDMWRSRRAAWNILTVTWPIAVLMFSATMLFTALMRDSAKAVMAAIWFGLLIYFLPLLVGGLRWMNVFDMLFEGGRGQPSILMDIVAPMLPAYGHATRQVVSGPVAVPVPVVHETLTQWVWRVVGSPAYLRYLAFVTVMVAGSAGCLVLSVAAVKRQWLWQPGQKTLAWTIGLSAAVIFSLAMFQVGHNLEPATTCNGRPIDPVMRFGWPAERTHNWASPPVDMTSVGTTRYMSGRRICTSGNYLYAVDAASENPNRPVQKFDGLLDICQFPGVTGKGVILSRMRFATTPSLSDNMQLGITFPAMSLRGGRLSVVYQLYVPGEDESGPAAVRAEGTFSLRSLVVDVSDPLAPRRTSDVELDRSKSQVFQDRGDCWYGKFCYIWGQKQLLVVSLADPGHPKVVRKISIADFGLDPDRPQHVQQVSVGGDKLLCAGPLVVLLLDLADPQAPRMVFRRALQPVQWEEDAIQAALYADGLLYLATGSGLEIHRLSPTPTGELHDELVGRRQMTPLERLAGRRPQQLILHQGCLYEADERFGVLVYDVSDPSRPRRAYHASADDYVTAIGTWEGLLYMSGTLGSLTLVAMP